MTPRKFHVLSPDWTYHIAPEPFDSLDAALEFAVKWCERYERQGYYETANGTRVPAKYLRELVSIQFLEFLE